jgi:hypothetical protein
VIWTDEIPASLRTSMGRVVPAVTSPRGGGAVALMADQKGPTPQSQPHRPSSQVATPTHMMWYQRLSGFEQSLTAPQSPIARQTPTTGGVPHQLSPMAQ